MRAYFLVALLMVGFAGMAGADTTYSYFATDNVASGTDEFQFAIPGYFYTPPDAIISATLTFVSTVPTNVIGAPSSRWIWWWSPYSPTRITWALLRLASRPSMLASSGLSLAMLMLAPTRVGGSKCDVGGLDQLWQ